MPLPWAPAALPVPPADAALSRGAPRAAVGYAGDLCDLFIVETWPVLGLVYR